MPLTHSAAQHILTHSSRPPPTLPLQSLLDHEREKSATLEAENTLLKEKNRALALKVEHLERNISCLYLTAKCEAERAAAQLTRLRQQR